MDETISAETNMPKVLEHNPRMSPSNLEQLRKCECKRSAEITTRHKCNETPVMTTASR